MPDITAARPTSGAPIESAWGGQVHDSVEGIQAGTINATFGGSALSPVVTVTFPRAYTAPPVVVATVNSNTAGAEGPHLNVGTRALTATTLQLQAEDVRGTSQSATVAIHWLAIGTPA